MQPINYTALVVKYLLNVVAFAVIYAILAYFLLSINITGFTASAISIVIAGLGMMAVMRKVGPWIDQRLAKK